MDALFKLTNNTVDELVESVDFTEQEQLLHYLATAISNMPSMSGVISLFIVRAVEASPVLKDKIIGLLQTESSDDIERTSKRIYAEYLGSTHDNMIISAPISDILASVAVQTEAVPPLFTDAAERYSEQSGCSFEDAFTAVFYSHSIIQRFDFYKSECLSRLRERPVGAILEALLLKETLADLAMIIELCHREEFFLLLVDNIGRFRRRSEIAGLIFTAFYNDRPYGRPSEKYEPLGCERDRKLLAGMFDEEAEQYALRIGDPYKLGCLLNKRFKEPRLPYRTHQQFKNLAFSSKREFFEAFLELTSPTPAHFLSYLELYKTEFLLTDEEQRLFLGMLSQFHQDDEPFLSIVIPKLKQFGILAIPC